jgi:hypothetical protein
MAGHVKEDLGSCLEEGGTVELRSGPNVAFKRKVAICER